MRQLLACGVRVRFQETDRRHDESGHAERTLESLLVDDRLLYRMQRAVCLLEPFDGLNLPVANRVRQNRARVVRHVVDEDGAGAALGTVATQLGSRETKLV